MSKTKFTLLIFLAILTIKVSLSFFINGTIVYPDENCLLLKAREFTESGLIKYCGDIVDIPGTGDPMPLYSILISPVFLFFSGITSLKAILVLNAILSSLLFFPLKQIFQKFIKKEKFSMLCAIIILFLPQTMTYEKMAMSENLFFVFNTLILYFYLNSFEKEKKTKLIYKLTAFLLATLCFFTRPFGIITLLALIISESTIALKKSDKIKKIFTLIGFFILSMTAIIGLLTIMPNTITALMEKAYFLTKPEYLIKLVEAFKNQINSLFIITYFIPSVIFLNYAFTSKSKNFKNIKIFLFSIIILNILIGTQHIFGYFLSNYNLDLLTRYINISATFIIIFFLISIFSEKKLRITPVIFGLCLLPLLFLNHETINHALNIELSPFYKSLNGFVSDFIFFKFIFLIIIFILSILYIFEKKKSLIILLISIFVTHSALNMTYQIIYTKNETSNELFQFLKNKKENIVVLEIKSEFAATNFINFDYWRLKTLTDNIVKLEIYDDSNNKTPKINPKEAKYILSKLELNFDKILTTKRERKLYEIKQ